MSVLTLIWESFWHILLNVLVGINSVVQQPALAIIIFTVLMRLLTVPLTMKALKSSRNMQQIQPLIKEIQKKHGKDRQKQQEETMKLYAQYGINPAASCFPMLIQLPIFIGLYSALRFTLDVHTGTAPEIAQHMAELQAALWNPGWANTAANFSQSFLWVPSLALADPVHIWPVLSGIFQFIQSRMSMPVRDPSMPMDSQQKMMQNMMQFMPLYIVFISWGFPAGNVIYWAFSSLFGAAQQYFITGFGTLPDLPGLGFLPRKQAFLPLPPPPMPESADGVAVVPRRAGVMNWMMNKAVQAQEAQKAAVEQPNETDEPTRRVSATAEVPRITGGSTALRGGNRARTANGSNSAATQPVGKGKGSVYGSAQDSNAHEPREVPTSTMKYAADLKYRASGNGLEGSDEVNGSNGATPLPRRKKSKR